MKICLIGKEGSEWKDFKRRTVTKKFKLGKRGTKKIWTVYIFLEIITREEALRNYQTKTDFDYQNKVFYLLRRRLPHWEKIGLLGSKIPPEGARYGKVIGMVDFNTESKKRNWGYPYET